MAFLRLEKVKWSHFFLQKRHFKYKLSVKKQKRGQKMGKKPQKRGVFIGTSALIPQTVRTICRIPQTVRTISGNGAHHLRNSANVAAPFAEFCKWCAPFAEWRQNLVRGAEKTPFCGGFLPVFVLFFACSQTICTWHGYFSKKSDPACFFSRRDHWYKSPPLHRGHHRQLNK